MKTLRMVVMGLAVAAIGVGCARSTHPKAMPESGTMGAKAASVSDAANYKTTFTKMSTRPFRSASHAQGKVYVEVWVNDTGEATYLAKGSPYPVGTTIVKEHFPVTETGYGKLAGYLVMEKKEAGYDPAHNNWYYAMVNPMTNVPMAQGKMDMCIGCHARVSATDYVFGVPDSVNAHLK